MNKRLKARADALLARVKKGDAIEAVAASAGGQIASLARIDRASAGQNRTVSPDVLNQLFASKTGAAFIGQDVQFGFVVAKVTAIRGGDLAQAAQIAESQRPQVTMQMFEEIGQLGRKSARTAVKVKTDFVRAKTALGFAPEEAKGAVDDTKAPAKTDAKAK